MRNLILVFLLASASAKAQPISWRTLIQEAQVSAAKKDTAQAFLKFRQAIQAAPDSAEPYYYRGLCYYQCGNRAKALRDIGQAISRSAENPRYYYVRGVIGMDMQDFEGAADQFSAALLLDSTNAFLYFCRAQAMAGAGNIPAALADMTASVRYDSTNAEAFFNRAMLYVKVRAVPKAIADLSKALTLDVTFDTAFIERGKLFLAINSADACQDFIRASRLGSFAALELLKKNCTATSQRTIDSLRVFAMPTASVVANADAKERAKYEVMRTSKEGLRSVRYWSGIGSNSTAWRRAAGLQGASPFGQVAYGITINGGTIDCGSGAGSSSTIDLSCVIQELRNQAYVINEPLLQTFASTLQQKYLDYRQIVLGMSGNAQYAGQGFASINNGLPQEAIVLLNDIEMVMVQIQKRIVQLQQDK